MLKTLIVSLLLILLGSVAAADNAADFTVTLPAGWNSLSSGGVTGAADPVTGAVFYAYQAPDLESALVQANVLLAEPATLAAEPVEVTGVDLPSGAWEQRVYIAGDLITLALAQQANNAVYVMLVHAPLGAAESLIPVIQPTLNSFALAGSMRDLGVTVTVTYPAPGGEYAVGRMETVWSDDSRDDVFSADPDDHRQVPVTLWYPAGQTSAASRAAWLSPELAAALAPMLGTSSDVLQAVEVNAYQDAPLADAELPFPVVILSHGDRTVPALYTTYAEALASHGFVVVGVAHPYNALVVTLKDGVQVTAVPEAGVVPPGINPAMSPLEIAYAIDAQGKHASATAAADLRFVIDQLVALERFDSKFSGRLNLDHLGVMGHSLGGAAAIETLIQDSRVDAAVNLDGTVFSAVNVPVDRPVLIIATGYPELTDTVTSDRVPPGLTSAEFSEIIALTTRAVAIHREWPQVQYVTLQGTAHNNFTDAGLLAQLLPALRSDLGAIDARYALEISTDYVVTFFRGSLMAETVSLSELTARYPESVLHVP